MTLEIRALRIEVVERLEELNSLAAQWTALVGACPRPSVFSTLDWYRCWWEAFGEHLRPVVLCAWEDDRLVGAVPLCADSIRFRGMKVRWLGYPINGVTGEAGFLVPLDRRDVFDTMLEQVARQSNWHLLELRRMPCDLPHWSWLLETARRHGLMMTTRPDHQVPIIPIQGDWEAFLAGRSKAFRKTIRRRLGRIEESPQPVRVVRLTRRQEILDALPAVFAISSHSWKAKEGQALTDQPHAREFYRLLSQRLGELGQVDLWMVYIGDEPAAFEYHLRFAGISYPIRADFDERFGHLSPGAHLEYEILRQLHQDPAHQVHEYNTCADGYAYERKWTDLIRAQGRVWLFPRTLYGRLLHLLSRARRPCSSRSHQERF
jgi:CelD/BcsL family acetyltransferase involved in cellulose biosynthesis